MLKRFRPSCHSIIALIGLVTLLGVQSEKFSVDPGTGWHLKGGELMRQQALSNASPSFFNIPLRPLYHDPFLAVPPLAPPRNWICDQWVSDIILSWWYDQSSFSGVNILFAGIFSLTFFVFLYRSCVTDIRRSPNLFPIAYSLAALIAFKLAQVHFILRPVVFSFPLFVLIWSRARSGVHRISDGVECDDLEPSRDKAVASVPLRDLFFYPLLFVLWANLHPSFLFGIIWLLLGAMCAAFYRRWRNFVGEISIALLCLAATLLNPFGIGLHRSIFALTGSNYFMKMNQEWLPPDLRSSEGQFFLIVVVGSLAGIGLSLWQRVKASSRERRSISPVVMFDLLSFAIGLTLACRSVRTVPIFGIVSTPVFYSAIIAFTSLLLSILPSREAISAAWASLNKKERSTTRLQYAEGAALFSIVIIALSLFPQLHTFRSFTPSIETAGYPTTLITSLVKDAPSGERFTVFALPSLGGTIAFYGYPTVRAVIDDRNTLLGEEFYREYFTARESADALRRFIEKFKVTHILMTEHESLPLHSVESPRVSLVATYRGNQLYVLDPPRE